VIRHVFLWSVDPSAGEDAAETILAAMRRIQNHPLSARSWWIGRDRPPRGTEDSGSRWEYGVITDYDDEEHFVAFHATAEVLAVSAEVNALISGFAIFDFEIEGEALVSAPSAG
jgi:hypothetical protein